MVPFIAPVGLCEEYFPIECLAELVVSKNCKDDAGYGEFLTSLATDIGGLEFAGCIMDSFGDEYCAKVGDELEQAFFQCLSGASRCRNKEEMIIECEKEYLDHSRQSTEKIDREFEMADANQTRYQDKKK
ncbi:unnamed protein product [Gongylonema pulchrum]|uniref:COX assembly mitochondrial protein n=1 Tax=Gongylonema pulchrum TaxID=637853 RepID=A0A183D0I4_9BILA|nr:unnamed protein product [Gongylonema pulchrum]